MVYSPFFESYISSRYTPVSSQNLLTPLLVYNETKYGKLNNLDYRFDIPTFNGLSHSASINSLSLESINDRYLLSGSSDSSIKLWDLNISNFNKDKNQFFKPIHIIPMKSVHSFGITKIKWWPDNGMFLSSSYDFKLNLFDSNEMNVVHSFKLNSRILDFDFYPFISNNSLISCCLDGGIGGLKLIDLRSLSDSHNLGGGNKLKGGVGFMSSCCWSPINSNLCIGGNIDGSCYGWDIRSSKKYLFELDSNLTISNFKNSKSNNNNNNYPSSNKRRKFNNSILKSKAHNGLINSIMFNDNGDKLFTLGNDEKLKVWDMSIYKKKPVHKAINFGPLIRNKFKQHIEMCLSPIFETELQFLWVPSDNGELLVYRVDNGSLVARLRKKVEKIGSNRSHSIVCSKHNKIRYYSGCNDGTISVWGYDDYLDRPDTNGEPIIFDNGVDPVLE